MPTVNLVPLGLGELLDQTFSTFRKHFWLFAGIMVFPQGILVGFNIIFQVYMGTMALPPPNPHNPMAAAQAGAFGLRAALLTMGLMIPYFLVYTLALGANTHALSEVYLGRAATIRESYWAVRRKFWRLLGVFFSISLRIVGFSILVVILLTMAIGAIALIVKPLPFIAVLLGLAALIGFIAAGVLMVIFLMRYSVAIPAVVVENLKARQALKRSVALTRGNLWRLLVVGVLMWLISMTIVSLCQSPFSIASILASVKGGRPSLWLAIPGLLLGGVGGVATAPLLMISFAVAYYDLRVRKEAFDLYLMMSNLDENTPQGVASRAQEKREDRLEDSSVPGAIFLTILTLGLYPPIWFMTRRKAFNHLQSREKLGRGAPAAAFLLMLVSACLPFAGGAKWGSWVQAENALGPVHPLILLAAGIILAVQCFKVRRILLDHLAPREEGMFSASIRFQYDDLLSRVGTFFLGIFYLQFKINELINRLAAGQGAQGETAFPVPQGSPASPINL